MLGQLKQLHADLREAIAALEAETARPAPNPEALAAARLRLTRVSRQRRALIDCTICPMFHDAAPADLKRIGALRMAGAKSQISSSEHIGRWTTSAILADWPGYRRASLEMVTSMHRRIAEEAATLYPLLEQKSRRAA